MSKSFTAYNYDDAADLVGRKASIPLSGTRTFPVTNQRRPLTALSATQFYLGDHWQSSRGFIGQLPPASLPGASQILADIRDGFVSENVIQEIVETHVSGILGREPVWSFLTAEDGITPKRTTRNDFENVTGEMLTQWWNDRQALEDLQKCASLLVTEGIAVRRMFFPRSTGGKVTASSIANALKFIYFETLTADVAGVFTDADTQQDIGIFLYEEKDDQGEIIDNAAELSFLNERGDTMVRIVRDRGQNEEFGPYQLGGRLLIYELDRRALITEQVQSNQRSLNLAHTMMMRNVNMAGSRERTVTNAQAPINVKGVDTNSTVDRHPGTYKTGSGAVNFLMGVPIRDENGNIVGYTNPNVNITDPVPVITFQETIGTEKEAIYSQCHQRHVLIVDKADTSGRAREVARREFERSLKQTKTVVDASGRWQLETALRLAAQVSRQVSKYANLRADFNCLIDAGEPDPVKQQTTVLLRQPGGPANRPLISDETARNWIGVEDNAAEEARIDAEAKEHPPVKVTTPVPGQQIPNPDQQTQQLPQVQ